MNSKKGFTLVELLAVIVILAVILVIAVPNISSMIKSTAKGAFESDTKMVLNAIKLKLLEDSTFDPTTINETNIESILKISATNYKDVTVTVENTKPTVIIAGKNKWDSLVASGTSTSVIVDDGLILWLDAGNAQSYSGTGAVWRDLSGNNYNADIFGTSVWTSANGGKFDFGNVAQITQYIRLPYLAAQATGNSYTLEFWMQPLSYGSGHFCSMANGSTDNYFIMLQGSTAFQRYQASGSMSYSDNEMLQFAIVRNNSDTGTLYKNGGNAAATTPVGLLNGVASGGWILNQEQDSVGGSFDSTQNFRGAFMMIRLYNRALTTQEIQQNFNNYKARYGL